MSTPKVGKKIQKGTPHNHPRPLSSHHRTAKSDPALVELEKAIIERPNDSEAWIKLVAFLIEKGDLEKARGQIERALAVISFSSEADKKNIWTSFLNLEFHFGSADSFDEVFKRAIPAIGIVEAIKRVLELYSSSNRFEEAEEFVKDLIKRSKDRFAAWQTAVEFTIRWREAEKKNHQQYKALDEKVKELMRRSLQSLPIKDHVQFIVKYALTEYKAQNFEQARTNFENVLKNFPKRIDLWNVYVDAEIKHAKDVAYARSLFERMATFKNNLKQMQSFFKKYLAFEDSFGDTQTQNHVKEKAQRFVEQYISSKTTAENEAETE